MRQKSGTMETSSERIVKNIRRATRKQYSAEEKIRIVLDGLRGESSIAELCRREGIADSLYYNCRRSYWRPASDGSGLPTAMWRLPCAYGRRRVEFGRPLSRCCRSQCRHSTNGPARRE
jgi:transposase